MLISLIIPVLNEEENLPVLWARLCDVAERCAGYQLEVVFVDDGSTDDTVRCIGKLVPRSGLEWRLISLSRNFGHQAAISAGMKYANGAALVFLDADLQDPPELIPAFLEKFREGYDVVYGVRQKRKEPMWLRFCFAAFYRLFNSIAEHPIPLDAGDFGLMSRRVAHLMTEMPESDRLIRGLRSWIGFKQIGISYERPAREHGSSRYRIRTRVEGALDGLFGFSKLPIRFAFFLGVFVFAVGGIYLAQSYVMMFFTGDKTVVGWRSLITLAFMLGAANLIAVATVGEYVCRIYFQSKGRPLFIVNSANTGKGSHDNGAAEN